MRYIDKETFVCIDCETTGLDTSIDRVIEVGVAIFRGEEVLESYETLIDPEMLIPESSTKIHNITDSMVKGKPKIAEVLPRVIELAADYVVVGHGVHFDLEILGKSAERASLPFPIGKKIVDTFRLARLYGESPANSLDQLRMHFNIQAEGAHRALGDAIVNIQVFRFLSRRYKLVDDLFDALSKPILLKVMPLGKHKGRPFSEIPIDYIKWASYQEFDQDLLFSLKSELKKRKGSGSFNSASNPFSDL